MKLVLVCGARPNFIKIASIVRALGAYPTIQPFIIHTGQHYDENMSRLFFEQLSIPKPDINLEVGSGTHARQTGEIMQRIEPVLLEQKPDAVLVVGDVNSTIASGLVAAKLHIPLIHVEAGLRSFDRTMPEEINRVLTDAISDLLFVSEPSGVENLKQEGVDTNKIHFVGNVMIDTLLLHLEQARQLSTRAQLGVDETRYGVITLHRPANVDHPEILTKLIDTFQNIQRRLSLVFCVHPRTQSKLSQFGLDKQSGQWSNIIFAPPLGYLDFLCLMSGACVVLTDSGGIQEETTILSVPCLTLRTNTERPITLTHGTNQLVGQDPEAILRAFGNLSHASNPIRSAPPFWDGHAGDRIARIISNQFAQKSGQD